MPAVSVVVEDRPRKLQRRTLDDVASLIGAAIGSLALVWVLYERVFAFSGLLGFVLCWYVTFVVLYAWVTGISNPRTAVVDRVETAAAVGQPLLGTEKVLHTVDQLGGALQVGILPLTWVDANLAFLNRHAPGASNTAGGAVRVSRLIVPGITLTAQLDVNESFIGPNAVGTFTIGVCGFE